MVVEQLVTQLLESQPFETQHQAVVKVDMPCSHGKGDCASQFSLVLRKAWIQGGHELQRRIVHEQAHIGVIT